jgi:hypothetical protein
MTPSVIEAEDLNKFEWLALVVAAFVFPPIARFWKANSPCGL